MPLLRQEQDIFPEDAFALPLEESPWWVAHVRSRQEKVLARYLRPLGVAHYLPQREHRVRRAGRNFVSFLPLFPGYLFFRGSVAQRLLAVRSNLIVRVLDVLNQDRLSQELRQLHALKLSGASLVPCEPLAEGDTIRIVEGPFKGYIGVVLRGERPRLLISISVLRKAVAVELDRSAAELLPSAALSGRHSRSAVA